MRVLITGVTGLIGPPVLDRLFDRGDEVTALALPGTADALPSSSALTVVEGSVESAAVLKEAACGAEVVYHLAGLLPGSPPAKLRRVNVTGTRNLLAACGRPTRRFVFVSSVAVYRPMPWRSMWPVSEEAPRGAHGGLSARAYSQSKIDAEDTVRANAEKHGMEYVIVRPPTAYGSGARCLADAVKRVVSAPRISGPRLARLGAMQWVHTADLAEGIILSGTHDRAGGRTFNIAGGELVTVPRLLEAVGQIQSSRAAAVAVDMYGPQRYEKLRFDISSARRVLGYVPAVPLSEGLRDMLADLGRRPEGPD